MRLFVAISAEGIKTYIKNLQEQFKIEGLRFTHSFHITLKFLGNIKDKEKVVQELSKIKFEKFTLETSVLGVFPNTNYVRVLWLGIKDNEKLKYLHSEIEERLSYLNIKEKHDFHPHITLARVSYLKDKKKFNELLKKIKTDVNEFYVNDFVLYKSTLTKNGPVYDAVEKFN